MAIFNSYVKLPEGNLLGHPGVKLPSHTVSYWDATAGGSNDHGHERLQVSCTVPDDPGEAMGFNGI